MATVPSLMRHNKLAMFRHYFPLTNDIFPRKSHNLSAGHSNPGQDVVSNRSSGPHQLLDEMLKRDVESATPNEYTFGTVIHSSVLLEDLHLGRQIHAYAKKISLSSNVFVGSAMLDLYVKLSNIYDALRAFQDIHEPNVVSYATLIHGYIKEGRFDEAGVVFRSMPERNVVSWNTMISGCSQSGKNEEAVNFFVEMLRDGVVPSQSTYPCAIIAAANVGALGIGRSIQASAVKFLVSWNAVICGYAQNGLGNGAILMYEKMKLTGIQPNSITLLGLLLACNHVGLIDEGFKYFNQARYEDPSLLKSEHYACMIDLLSRSGRFQEAERFLHHLPFDPGVGFWKACLEDVRKMAECIGHKAEDEGERIKQDTRQQLDRNQKQVSGGAGVPRGSTTKKKPERPRKKESNHETGKDSVVRGYFRSGSGQVITYGRGTNARILWDSCPSSMS
ncbi:Pentatricopeptide repeat-containing protein, mitochondrial [Sesamum angolense]|uniref:Pentatricopeptide repeat-containing protein, mitochondrial n=1 Tax=Sesamum angolense TaxID=2727404 RepID=A0AAE1WN04_9LAMI|nr:Pentatricopeptide repeat-containing protein, mitochondrial [Sesamum angolense]